MKNLQVHSVAIEQEPLRFLIMQVVNVKMTMLMIISKKL